MRIEDLKVGDELVCIDRDGFLSASTSSCHLRVLKGLIDSQIIVSGIVNSAVCIKGSNHCLYPRNLKHFKKKEEPSFNDLIDVAVQAVKDGVIATLVVNKGGIEFTSISDRKYYAISSGDFTSRDIDVIQSLYKETFVIESEEDIKRIIKGARITLTNDNLLTAKNTYYIVEDYIVIDAYTDECTTCQNLNYNIGIVFLKGATVEQDRHD